MDFPMIRILVVGLGSIIGMLGLFLAGIRTVMGMAGRQGSRSVIEKCTTTKVQMLFPLSNMSERLAMST
jgi:hypothetical protein